MTVEPEPQVIELRGPEAMLLHHTYGTNGIVLELEVALTPAVEWTECIATFAQFDAALEFADRFGSAPGLEKKEVCFVAAPIPQYFTSLAEHLPADQHAVLLLVAPHSEAGMRDMVAQHGGQVTYRKTADEVASSHKTLLEYTWNHTTLHALKVDKGLTYIQSGFNPMHRLKQVRGAGGSTEGRGDDAPGVSAHQGRRLQLQRPADHPLHHRGAPEPDHADLPRPWRADQQPACVHRGRRQAEQPGPGRGGHEAPL